MVSHVDLKILFNVLKIFVQPFLTYLSGRLSMQSMSEY